VPEALRTVGAPARRNLTRDDANAANTGGLVAIPVRTPLVKPGDDLAAIVANAVRGIASSDAVIAVSETAAAIAQGRMVPAELVRPSRLAYALSQRAGALATVNQPESLQLVIDRVGAPRVALAAIAHVVGRLFRRRGDFYRVLGEALSAIDGYTGTMPPYERTIVLEPNEPAQVAGEIAQRCGCAAAIVDVNDLGVAKVLGASGGVQAAALEAALRGNPHGNGDEQTPVVVLPWRGAGASPLLASDSHFASKMHIA
jgi:F420-0:Gamma-glutamyl ligase